MKSAVMIFFMILAACLSVSAPEILIPREDKMSNGLYNDDIILARELDFQDENRKAVVNEETIIRFLSRYPDAIIEEVISGNQHALADLLSRWPRRKQPDERFFWEFRAYKLGFMLRFNPEVLLETIAKSKKEVGTSLVELFCPDARRYRTSARIYLLKSRIQALDKVNKPELKPIKDIFLAKMQEILISTESEYLNQDKVERSKQNQLKWINEEHFKEWVKLIPEPILKACSDVEYFPSRENIKFLLKELNREKDGEILYKMMKTHSFGGARVFLLSGVLDILQEEALAGVKEAIEILLYLYLYGDDDVRESVAAENLAPLIRANARLFLEVISEYRSKFYAVSFPVDSLATLPPISEVCEYFLSKRMEALDQVKDKDLVNVRDVCLSLIKRKIEEVHKSNRSEKLSKNT
jgi:hypothetical protein